MLKLNKFVIKEKKFENFVMKGFKIGDCVVLIYFGVVIIISFFLKKNMIGIFKCYIILVYFDYFLI